MGKITTMYFFSNKFVFSEISIAKILTRINYLIQGKLQYTHFWTVLYAENLTYFLNKTLNWLKIFEFSLMTETNVESIFIQP